jgi:probable biosynthetic protein (TIGR04098 family)
MGAGPGAWRDYRIAIGMPHLAPGRLSEVELVKQLAALQWQSVAELAGVRQYAVLSEKGERLHATMVSVELGLGQRSLEQFDEGTPLFIKNRVAVFGRKLVEGHFLFDGEPVDAALLDQATGVDELRAGVTPWCYLTHTFTSRSGAKVVAPAPFAGADLPELERMPAGISDHMRVERTGRIEGFPDERAVALASRDHVTIPYRIVPESDLNAAGALYCARYLAIMNYGERVFLGEHLERPFSMPLLACLSTERRRAYYFANADPHDSLRIAVEASLLPASDPATGSLQALATFLSRVDLYRASDGVLIGSSLARKALRVPGQLKSVLAEAERLLSWLV